MDDRTAEVLVEYGINPSTVPQGTVKLLTANEYKNLGKDALLWAQHPQNDPAMAYEIETEHQRAAGLVLRNLHPRSQSNVRPHLTLFQHDVPFWHNWTPALPLMWETGVVALVEGPKDARVMYSEGIRNVLAYLGPVPSIEHLKVLRRYVHTIVWFPDNEVLDPETASRRDFVLRKAQEFGLSVRHPKLPAKDPGVLVLQRPRYFDEIRKTLQEIIALAGGGYKEKSHVLDEQVQTQNSPTPGPG